MKISSLVLFAVKSFNFYEVAIIGGRYAGLSAAMALSRARRPVLALDAQKPRNRFTLHARKS